jgi:hypothetical protein
MIFLVQNSFPMKQWHAEHMEKTVVKYVSGLSQNASVWERKQHKKYGSLTNVCRQIDYDMKHGVTMDQVVSFLDTVRSHSSFAKIRNSNEGSVERLEEMARYFASGK